MMYRDMQTEILSGPKAAACAPFVNDGTDPARKSTAPADDAAIAAILSAGRVVVTSREIGDGAVSIALGIPDGPLFLYQLETLADTPPADGAEQAEIIAHAVARQAWRSLSKAAFDVGNAAVRAGIDLFVGSLLTAEQAQAIKALAEAAETITAADVSRAMRGPWGDE